MGDIILYAISSGAAFLMRVTLFMRAALVLLLLVPVTVQAADGAATKDPQPEKWERPKILVMGSSMMNGRMNNCMAEKLESWGYEPNLVGLCGLSTKALANGWKYPCPWAKFTGPSVIAEAKKELRISKRLKSGENLKVEGMALKNRKGELFINHLLETLKPVHFGFFLGGNEAGYKKKRALKTEKQRATYRKKLHSYIHADTLLGAIKSEASCTWITGTWVSKVTSGYGKSNEEVVEVGNVLAAEAGDRCHIIRGTEVIGKKEVSTSDGMHLDRKSSCIFGERVANRLNRHLVLSWLGDFWDENSGRIPFIAERREQIAAAKAAARYQQSFMLYEPGTGS